MIFYLEMGRPLLNGEADWAQSPGCLSKNFIRKLEDGRVGFEAHGARAEALLTSGRWKRID